MTCLWCGFPGLESLSSTEIHYEKFHQRQFKESMWSINQTFCEQISLNVAVFGRNYGNFRER